MQLERLFYSFDENGSNSLDVQELHDMFLTNGVEISLRQVIDLFNTVDEDESGFLSVDEFKLLIKSKEANESMISKSDLLITLDLVFRNLVRQIRGNAEYKQKAKTPVSSLDNTNKSNSDWTDRKHDIWKTI